MSAMDRRNFIASLGAAALTSSVPTSSQSEVEAGSGTLASRSRFDLNGLWRRFYDGHYYDTVDVPSSLRPSGIYTLRREIVIPHLAHGERAYLHFEGITYAARPSINGTALGAIGPYVPYEFELTGHLKEGSNEVAIEIADLIPFPDGSARDEIDLGVNPGWEAYGGIIRDVYIEVRPASFIENVRFAYTLTRDFSGVVCSTQIFVASAAADAAGIEFILLRHNKEVARAAKAVKLSSGENVVETNCELSNPELWTPVTPHLYEIEARLKTANGSDKWSCKIGFRELKAVGREFRLNGERLILKGICRHDMWKDAGFTLTRTQQQQDMRMIKALGCNFVRLVHYPHDRYIIDLANELGLFVTEEPGYWIVDFTTMSRGGVELGYKILESTIRRDWNAPCVFGWILSNESTLTVETLAEGKRRCNQLDPLRRFVSAANSHPKEEAKPIYEKAGMDFFDQHPYTFDLDQFEAEADYFGARKPLTFTEWGGKQIAQSEPVMSETVDRFLDLTESRKLAGHCFWSWQDLRQYTRIDHEMRDGVLESGVVTEDREPRSAVYMQLQRLFGGRHHVEQLPDLRPQILPLRRINWLPGNRFTPIPLDPLVTSSDSLRAWTAFESNLAKYWASLRFSVDQWNRTGQKFELWPQPQPEFNISGLPFAIPTVEGLARPLTVAGKSVLAIPVDRPCSRIHVLGHAEFFDDCHAAEYMGQIIGTLTLRFDAAETREVPLRSGYEVALANQIDNATRIHNVALEAQPAIRYQKDAAREDYQFLLYSSPKVLRKRLKSISYEINQPHTSLVILGVTVEE
jgi:Glycosyl hydrolases family 2, TIM barrel domain/Glycosyl hydrolases family 2/Glycosyl hydrolases family 2, sugar binding domain